MVVIRLVEAFASDLDRTFRFGYRTILHLLLNSPSSVNNCNWREQLFSGYSPKDKGENEKRAENY
jgi:hypothetical protein